METKEKKDIRRGRPRSRAHMQQDVTYTQPKPFQRKRFLLQLLTVVAIVLAILFGMSIFFKVEKVEIAGTQKYDPWAVREASGIVEGENLMTFNKAKAASNVLAGLPYVENVRVGIRLPGTVMIQVTERDVVYAIQDQNNSWWFISADGKVIDTCKTADAEDHPRIVGVQLAAPAIGQPAVAYEQLPEPDETGETKPVTVYASDRLETALTIVQYMEQTGLLAGEYQVDVTDMGDIQIWHGTRFQMLLGNNTQLLKKIDALSQTVKKLDTYDTGVLDASFTYWQNQVGYTQFSSSSTK